MMSTLYITLTFGTAIIRFANL